MRTIHSQLPILFSLVLGLLFLGSCETDNDSDLITGASLYQIHHRLSQDSGAIAELIAHHYQIIYGDTLYPLGQTISQIREVAQTIPQFEALNQEYNLKTWVLGKLLFDPNLPIEDVLEATSLSLSAQIVLSEFISEVQYAMIPIKQALDAFERSVYHHPNLTQEDQTHIGIAISLMHFAVDSGGDDDDWKDQDTVVFKTALYAANQNTATAIIAVTAAVLVTR